MRLVRVLLCARFVGVLCCPVWGGGATRICPSRYTCGCCAEAWRMLSDERLSQKQATAGQARRWLQLTTYETRSSLLLATGALSFTARRKNRHKCDTATAQMFKKKRRELSFFLCQAASRTLIFFAIILQLIACGIMSAGESILHGGDGLKSRRRDVPAAAPFTTSVSLGLSDACERCSLLHRSPKGPDTI